MQRITQKKAKETTTDAQAADTARDAHELHSLACEVLDIAQLARGTRTDLVGLIVDAFRAFRARRTASKACMPHRSGFVPKTGQARGKCTECGDIRRLYVRPETGARHCADCVLTELLADISAEHIR